MEQQDNTIESLLTQVEELHLSQKEEMIGIKGRINNLEILSRRQEKSSNGRLVHECLGCPWRSIKQCQGGSLVLGLTPRTFRV
ncbi:unnamed protein product [Sphagnum troendelagicum]|uniref:Uncharacterized protein n=1 Tax=Sphagnum troendelagicum TaxID=128251 RepID=A0ABP0TG09_9BRYO